MSFTVLLPPSFHTSKWNTSCTYAHRNHSKPAVFATALHLIEKSANTSSTCQDESMEMSSAIAQGDVCLEQSSDLGMTNSARVRAQQHGT